VFIRGWLYFDFGVGESRCFSNGKFYIGGSIIGGSLRRNTRVTG
jgi:hypothetical protein